MTAPPQPITMALSPGGRAIAPLFPVSAILRPKPLTRTLAARCRLASGLPQLRQRARVPTPRRMAAVATAGLLALLPGCAGFRFGAHQTLHVVLVHSERFEWMRNDLLRDSKELESLLRAFRRLQPHVDVQVSLQDQDTLATILRRSSSRGMAPDLLLVRSAQAVSLLQEGLIDPLPSPDPALTGLLRMVDQVDLARVRTSQGLAGLPVITEFSLACYDRRRLSQPPTTLAKLLSVAAAGNTIGLAVDPIGLWWTAGGLGAEKVMVPILIGNARTLARSTANDRQSLVTWLSWLRQAALQSRVELTSGPRELTLGLESGQFAWVPCFSITLLRLNRTMGRHLGVAPLPSGPAGLASPYATTRVWSLGRNSTPDQRQLALQLAALSLDPLVQRQLMMVGQSFLPANRHVPIPVASSGRLAALTAADQQFRQGTPLMSSPFSLNRLQRVLPSVEAVLTDVMVGVLTPEQGADALLRVRPQAARAR